MEDTLKLMKSLSDGIRLRIINILYYSDLYVCEMVEILKLPQSTVSRHLNVMKNAGIIEYTKDGSWVKYKITTDNLFKSIVQNIIEKKLIYDNKCSEDVRNLKERMKHTRGCINKC